MRCSHAALKTCLVHNDIRAKETHTLCSADYILRRAQCYQKLNHKHLFIEWYASISERELKINAVDIVFSCSNYAYNKI